MHKECEAQATMENLQLLDVEHKLQPMTLWDLLAHHLNTRAKAAALPTLSMLFGSDWLMRQEQETYLHFAVHAALRQPRPAARNVLHWWHELGQLRLGCCVHGG